MGANNLINVTPLLNLSQAQASLSEAAAYAKSYGGSVVIETLPTWAAFFNKYVPAAQSVRLASHAGIINWLLDPDRCSFTGRWPTKHPRFSSDAFRIIRYRQRAGGTVQCTCEHASTRESLHRRRDAVLVQAPAGPRRRDGSQSGMVQFAVASVHARRLEFQCNAGGEDWKLHGYLEERCRSPPTHRPGFGSLLRMYLLE